MVDWLLEFHGKALAGLLHHRASRQVSVPATTACPRDPAQHQLSAAAEGLAVTQARPKHRVHELAEALGQDVEAAVAVEDERVEGVELPEALGQESEAGELSSRVGAACRASALLTASRASATSAARSASGSGPSPR